MTQRFSVTRLVALLCVLGAFSFAVVGCGSSSSSSNGTAAALATTTTGSSSISHTKAKFVLHAGLGFGAFHRWIYKPLKAGDFAHPLSHKFTIVKGALAAGFVVHELKLALTDAQADHDTLQVHGPHHRDPEQAQRGRQRDSQRQHRRLAVRFGQQPDQLGALGGCRLRRADRRADARRTLGATDPRGSGRLPGAWHSPLSSAKPRGYTW